MKAPMMLKEEVKNAMQLQSGEKEANESDEEDENKQEI